MPLLSPHARRLLSRCALAAFIISIAVAVHFLQRYADKSAVSVGALPTGEVEGVLSILSPHWEGIRVEFERGYNEWRKVQGKSPVKIDWLDVGGTSDIVKYIRSTFKQSPEGIDIDIFFGGGTEPYIALAREGLLARVAVPESILTNIPPDLHGQPLYDTNGYWHGAAMSGFGILYNKVVLSRFGLPIPKTWEDLTDPALRTWVGSGDLRKSGSTRKMYEIILQAYGWDRGMEIVSALAGNVRAFTQSASAVPKDIAVGEIAAGLCIDQYAWSTMERVGGDRLGFIMPRGLTVVNADAIGMLKGAPRPDLALEFIAFVLSEAGQKIWMLKKNSVPGAPREFQLNKMPVWPSLFDKYGGYTFFTDNPFKWTDSVEYDTAKGSARWGIFNDYIGTLFIDAHPECARAWKKVCSLPPANPLRELYMRDPMTEDRLMAAATNEYLDSRWRARTLAAWANDARKRYAEIISK